MHDRFPGSLTERLTASRRLGRPPVALRPGRHRRLAPDTAVHAQLPAAAQGRRGRRSVPAGRSRRARELPEPAIMDKSEEQIADMESHMRYHWVTARGRI